MLAAGLTPAAIGAIEEVNARYRELCLQNLSRERLMVDREFHLSLARLSGNQHLCCTLEGIFDRLILKRRVEGFHDTRGTEPYDDHVNLLAAMVAGQTELAQSILRHDINTVCSRFTQYLQEPLPQ